LRSGIEWGNDVYSTVTTMIESGPEPEPVTVAKHVSVVNTVVAVSSTTRTGTVPVPVPAPGTDTGDTGTDTGYNAEEYKRKLDVTHQDYGKFVRSS